MDHHQLLFAPAHPLEYDWQVKIEADGRFNPIVNSSHRAAGADAYCWLGPAELDEPEDPSEEVHVAANLHGSFVFRFTEPIVIDVVDRGEIDETDQAETKPRADSTVSTASTASAGSDGMDGSLPVDLPTDYTPRRRGSVSTAEELNTETVDEADTVVVKTMPITSKYWVYQLRNSDEDPRTIRMVLAVMHRKFSDFVHILQQCLEMDSDLSADMLPSQWRDNIFELDQSGMHTVLMVALGKGLPWVAQFLLSVAGGRPVARFRPNVWTRGCDWSPRLLV
jgi:hypothetical protein